MIEPVRTRLAFAIVFAAIVALGFMGDSVRAVFCTKLLLVAGL
jgi:hypothetical protein